MFKTVSFVKCWQVRKYHRLESLICWIEYKLVEIIKYYQVVPSYGCVPRDIVISTWWRHFRTLQHHSSPTLLQWKRTKSKVSFLSTIFILNVWNSNFHWMMFLPSFWEAIAYRSETHSQYQFWAFWFYWFSFSFYLEQ